MLFKLLPALEKTFRKELLSRIPELNLGNVGFIARNDYRDFSYNGDLHFPVGVTNSTAGITTQTELDRIFENTNVPEVIAQVTFHELGHALSLVFRGRVDRLFVPQYGFFEPDILRDQPKHIQQNALRNEIEAFAIQFRLHHLFDKREANFQFTVEGMLELIHQDPWIGILSEKDKRRYFREMYQYASLENINQAFEQVALIAS